jgi:hypothetical protein
LVHDLRDAPATLNGGRLLHFCVQGFDSVSADLNQVFQIPPELAFRGRHGAEAHEVMLHPWEAVNVAPARIQPPGYCLRQFFVAGFGDRSLDQDVDQDGMLFKVRLPASFVG